MCVSDKGPIRFDSRGSARMVAYVEVHQAPTYAPHEFHLIRAWFSWGSVANIENIEISKIRKKSKIELARKLMHA